jgi:hypothetical protein
MRKILVVVKRDDEWSAVLQAIREDHYHLLAGRVDVGTSEELDLLLKSPGGNLLTYEARVVRVTPGKGAALEVYAPDEKKPRGWSRKVLERVMRPIEPEDLDAGGTVKEFAGAPEVAAPEVAAPEVAAPEVPAAEVPAAEVPAEPTDAGAPNTAFTRLQKLSVTEKQKLALTAERTERAILARDNLKQVHVFVLKNPRVTDDEALEYTRFAGLSAQALTYIADNARWMRSSQLRFSLVKNPQVPGDVARRVIETLAVNEVRFLAKAEHVKTDVRQAARKYLERKGLL